MSLDNYQFKVIKLEEIKGNEFFRKVRYTDAMYYGETKNGIERHGQGIMLYFSGRMYEGSWESDKRSGYGREIFTNKN